MLYLVPTPIGNLRDITLRALDVLKEANVIVCEDTRRTKILLDHYGVNAGSAMISFHEHSGPGRVQEILDSLAQGQKVALVTDGGIPLISDPGFELVQGAIRSGVRVEALPGASACLTALVASGLAVDSFSFFGFLSVKSGPRKKKLEALRERGETLIFYESPFRLVKVLAEMEKIFGDREAAVARELTKKFEEVARGHLSELTKHFSSKKILGEIVILVAGKGRKDVLR